MVEPVMYVTIGLLAGCVLIVGVIPLVHARAVRLTMRRVETMTPTSMAEVQADKDLLRAEFAMSMHRLEKRLDQMRAKTTSQLVENQRLKLLVETQRVDLATLRAQTEALKVQITSYQYEIRELHERSHARPLREVWSREQQARQGLRI
jgi:hypothetical protein